jgi:hypothetical protein
MEESFNRPLLRRLLVAASGSDLFDRTNRRCRGWRRGEPATAAAEGSTLAPIAEGETWSIEMRGTLTVHCASGTLWVTAPADAMDVVLSGGERIQLSARGKLVILAMRSSEVWLPPGFIVEERGPGACRLVARAPR